MSLPLDWRTDPIVLIEADLLPLLSGVPVALWQRGLGAHQDEAELLAAISAFHHRCEACFSDVLESTGFSLDPEAQGACRAAGQAWRSLLDRWKQDEIPDLMRLYSEVCVPASRTALDEVRRVFIGGVLLRQAAHASLSSDMLMELSKLSRSIQFVAINASIEAGRCGDQGRAFGLIAEEIRELAQRSGRVIAEQRG